MHSKGVWPACQHGSLCVTVSVCVHKIEQFEQIRNACNVFLHCIRVTNDKSNVIHTHQTNKKSHKEL